MPASASEIIASLHLEPLPHEGGFYRRTYTSAAGFTDGRPVGTAIYFLITPDGFSALHSLLTDELWHFYAGDPVEHVMLDPTVPPDALHAGTRTVLGVEFATGQKPQLTVSGGVWQGARLAPHPRDSDAQHAHGWALLGCTMSPGWEQKEFTLGERDVLLARFPAWAADIHALTR